MPFSPRFMTCANIYTDTHTSSAKQRQNMRKHMMENQHTHTQNKAFLNLVYNHQQIHYDTMQRKAGYTVHGQRQAERDREPKRERNNEKILRKTGKNALTTKIILLHVFIAVLRANQTLSSYCRHSLSFIAKGKTHAEFRCNLRISNGIFSY